MPPKLLIADDDPDIRELLRDALSARFEVVEAKTGIELLELLADPGQFDLIITDIDMGWFDGIHAVAGARTAGVDVPIIVITAMSGPVVERRVACIPGAVLVQKPFSVASLVALVVRTIGPLGAA
jgi:two-component system OmpR family response regulator